MKRPMLLCAALSVILAFAAANFGFIAALILAGAYLIAAAAFIIFKRNKDVFIAFTLSILVFAGFCNKYFNYVLPYGELIESRQTFNGIVTGENTYSGSYTVKITGGDALKRGSSIIVSMPETPLEVGQAIVAQAVISPIDEDYISLNYPLNVYCTAAAESVKPTGEKSFIYNKIGKLRNYIKMAVGENTGYSESSIIIALLTGDKGYISDAMYNNIKTAGVNHVMVVSGMHLAIICGCVLLLLRKTVKNPKISAAATALIVAVLMLLCGFTASILRAGCAYLIVLAALFLLKKADPLNSLCIAVTVMLCINPYLLLSVGFLLSVTSTFGVVCIAPYICRLLKTEKIRSSVLRYITDSAIVTANALFATLPVTAYCFGGISLVAIPVNLLISYAVTLCLIFTLAGLILLPFISIAGGFLFKAAGITAAYIEKVINTFSALPFAYINVNFHVIIAAYFLIIAIFIIIQYTKNSKLKGGVNYAFK